MEIIDLTAVDLPAVGTYPAVFVDANFGTATDRKQRKYSTLTLVTEIAAEKSDGTRFTVSKRYVLNTKGQRKLRADLIGWRGARGVSGDELKKFNPETTFVGQPCQVVIGYDTEAGATVARITSYQAAGETKLTPSGRYTRTSTAASTTTAPTEASAQASAAV